MSNKEEKEGENGIPLSDPSDIMKLVEVEPFMSREKEVEERQFLIKET